MDDEYGLPQTIQDPYGLSAVYRAPVLMRPRAPVVQVPMMPPVVPMPQQPAATILPFPTAGGGGGGSFRATDPVQAPTDPMYTGPKYEGATTATPVIGKDIPLAKLVQLQRAVESTNNYTAINTEKRGNTASGAYQYTDSTWNNYGGYPKAMLAPKEVQDRRFLEDITKRANQYNGDLFKAIAAHNLPAVANRPELWNQPFTWKARGKTYTAPPVADYIRKVLKGTPYAQQLDAYLAQH